MAIKSFLSENGFSVGSIGSTPIDVIDTAGNVTGVSLTSSGGIITANTSIPSLRARDNITGPGGTISVDASYNISWSGRFIVISNGGTASTFSASGYFDINQPAVGTVITGLNGASNATVVSAGIPLASWHALYYILPIGSGATSLDANFRIVSYTANNLNIPAEWIQICLRNGDNGYVYFPNGVVLAPGNSSAYSGQSSANVANTAVNRDASGNFSAGTITATLSGNATTATTAGNVSGTVAIANGGTGQTTVTAANTAIVNWGQIEGHGTYTDFNTVPATWGFSFVQGSTNAPHATSSQWYRSRLSLGSGYGIGTGGGSYWLEMAMPRMSGSSAGNMYFRVNESGSVSSWYPVSGITTNSLTAGSYLTGGTFNGSAAVTLAVDATSANTASKIVARDAGGGFSAGAITATSFGDGYNTYTLAQINRGGGAVELQYNTTASGSNVNIFGNTANRWAWQADTGKLVLGFAADTNLYRGGADILKTDDAFEANSLTAVSSGTTQISINSTGSGSKELVFKNNGTVAGYVWHTGGYVAVGGGNASTSLAVLTSNGNVGIGTTGPSVKLEVYGADQRMKISTSAADAGSLTIGQWDGVTNRIESSNRKLLLTSYSGGISLGASGSEHVQIAMSGALTSTTSTSSPIYYDSANSSFYCDPAGTSSLAGATLSSDPASDRSAITRVWSTSRGENLVTNGSGLMGSNYNFSGFTFDAAQTHGGGGSFLKNVAYGAVWNDELMPVDIEKTYRLVAWARSGEDGGTNYNASNFQYLGIVPIDIDGYLVEPFSYSKYPGSTDTTLAAPLNTGATTMTLTSAAGWLNTAGDGAYQRQMVWYGYTNSKGYTYPNYTYTRNISYYISSTYQANGMWAVGGISGNVVTLTAPWPGPNIPAGTAVRNTNSGGTYKYITITGAVPNTWTRYEGYIGGIDTGGEQLTNKFPYGTAFAKMVFLINYHGLANNNTRFSDIWFSETSSRNLEGATTNFSGVVTTGAQSFAGDKVFTGNVTSAGFYNSTDSTNRFVQGSLVLRNSAPTVYFRDTDNNSAMIHVNGNLLHVLRGGVDTESWSLVNGAWPLTINLTNNDAIFGGTVTATSFIGNATTATTLQTARNIAGVSFNGSADISITGQNITTSVATAANDLEVAKYLRWKNYGNGHVLIDASQGTAPTGAAIDRYTAGQTITNAGAGSNTWGEAISLMGWNGVTTYGVRVDRARTIDNQANSATTTAGTANFGNTIVLRDASGNFNAGTITANLSGSVTGSVTGSVSGSSRYLAHADGPRNLTDRNPNWTARTAIFDFVGSGTTGTGGNYAGVLTFVPWDGATASSGDASYQLAFGSSATNGSGVPQLNIRNGIDTTWNVWRRIPLYGVNAGAGGGTLHATQFIDSDDTNYYVDPSGVSYVKNLGIGIQLGASTFASNGQLQIGTTGYDYLFTQGTWASSITAGILAHCADNWEFAIHDGGHRVASAFALFGGATNLLRIGRDIGWGVTPVEIAGNLTIKANLIGSANSANLVANTSSSYGAWNISGSRNSYGGIYDSYSGVATMFDSSGNGGFYRESPSGRWYLYHDFANNCLGIGGTGTAAGYAAYVNGNICTSGFGRIAGGNLYIDGNYGRGIVGAYASTRLQGVFAMGDSYKLADDGLSAGTLYGIAWSHPNAGGVAANLNTHGALVMENGTFLAAISGSIRCRDDMRAPIFYDSNNTDYYVDPNSYSNFYRLSTYFAAKDQNTNWTTAFQNTPTSGMAWHGDVSSGGPTGTWWFYQSMRHSNSSNYWGTQIAYGWEDNANELYQRNISGNSFSGWVRYLNTNNVHVATNRVLRALGSNDGMDFNTTSYNSMYYAYIASSPNKPSSYSYPYGTILTFDPGLGGGGRAQFYVSHAGNDLCFRGGWDNNNSWQTWNRVLTDQQYTSYTLARGGDTMDAVLYFRTNTGGTYLGATSNARLQAYSTDAGPAFMSFHRSGLYAVNMGLDPDNVFRIGGWSASSNRLQLDMAGNLWTASSMRSSIFYDQDDTSYYIDPSSTADTAVRIRGGAVYGPNSTWGAYLLVGGNGRQSYIDNTTTASVCATNGNLHLDAASTFSSYINWYDGTNLIVGAGDSATERLKVYGSANYTEMSGSARAPLFYDRDNTTYYCDPASTSSLNYAQINSLGVNTPASGTAGEIRATNNITAYYSDERLKTKLGPIQDPIEKVKSLSGFYFAPNDTAMALGYQKTIDVGVSAQEVNAILPEIIAPAPIDPQYMTVRYEKLIPLLIEAIKAQQSQIEELQKKISELQPNK